MTKLYAIYLFKVVWLEFPYIPSLEIAAAVYWFSTFSGHNSRLLWKSK